MRSGTTLGPPLPAGYVHFVGEPELAAFSRFCHELVVDRDASFTLERRTKLYRHWLSTGNKSCMLITDGGRAIVAASIVLPLTRAAYDAYCFDGLDAIDIEPSDILKPSERPRGHLLVDILAANVKYVAKLPKPTREMLHGSRRFTLRHIAEFFDPDREPGPIVFMSTFSRTVGAKLRELGFDDGCVQKTADGDSPVYRVDWSRLDWFDPKRRRFYVEATELIRAYNRAG